jgi:hypothetical protein
VLLFVAAALISGCTVTTEGTPVVAPGSARSAGEPNFPTPRPTRTRPPTVALPPPSRPTIATPPPSGAPGAVALPPNAQGYVFIETKSGRTRCQISSEAVGCEAQFTNSPVQDGVPANGVNVSADGHIKWLVGNLGDIPAVTLDYQTYRAQGWTIAASSSGTRFSNDGTGHGMFVSIESVEAF